MYFEDLLNIDHWASLLSRLRSSCRILFRLWDNSTLEDDLSCISFRYSSTCFKLSSGIEFSSSLILEWMSERFISVKIRNFNHMGCYQSFWCERMKTPESHRSNAKSSRLNTWPIQLKLPWPTIPPKLVILNLKLMVYINYRLLQFIQKNRP